MLPLFHVLLVVQLGAAPGPALRARARDARLASRPAPIASLRPAATAAPARPAARTGSAAIATWIADVTSRSGGADGRLQDAARWVAALPLEVDVRSGAVSMSLTVRTP